MLYFVNFVLLYQLSIYNSKEHFTSYRLSKTILNLSTFYTKQITKYLLVKCFIVGKVTNITEENR